MLLLMLVISKVGLAGLISKLNLDNGFDEMGRSLGLVSFQ